MSRCRSNMSVLEREQLASAYIHGWQNTAPPQFVEELASLSQETHRIPDPYAYSITAKGELFSPTAKCLVKETIDDKISSLGQLEYQAVLATEQWVASNEEGVSIWISPPKTGIYPTAKIIIQEIEHEDNAKKIFNRAIVLGFNEAECMKFAWNLTSFSLNKPIFRDADQIRAIPLILDTKNKPWVDILEKLIDAPDIWAMIRNGEDKQHKKEALRQAAVVQKQFFANPRLLYSDEAKIAVMQMLGPHQGSCPPKTGLQSNRTAFQVFWENSFIYSGSVNKDPDFCKSCPVCNKEINCIVRTGGSCPECGAVKRCG